jgi:hypothetical protein
MGSVLGVVGVTVGLGAALLTWMVVLDIAWLRIACFVGFMFAGLWLKRVLVIGALGSALGLPAALVMVLPDVGPLPPESLVEFVLWLWLCVALGLTVNLGVQLLLAPGDPLTLLQRERDTRIPPRELFATLYKLTNQKFDEEDISGISLSDDPRRQVLPFMPRASRGMGRNAVKLLSALRIPETARSLWAPNKRNDRHVRAVPASKTGSHRTIHRRHRRDRFHRVGSSWL